MTEALLTLIDLSEAGVWLGLAVFLRVGAAMAFLPVFGDAAVPVRVKLALSLGFTLVVAPALAGQVRLPDPGLAGFIALLGSETIAGLALGFTLRLFLFLLQIAGTIAAQTISLSQILGNQGVDPQPAVAQILMVAALGLAAMAGLHVRVAYAFIASYDVMPPGEVPLARDLADWALARVARTFAVAFTYAAPFLVGAVLYNLALGVINRAMPQLMVAFVGAPAITGGGLAMLALTAPILLPLWLAALNAELANPFLSGD